MSPAATATLPFDSESLHPTPEKLDPQLRLAYSRRPQLPEQEESKGEKLAALEGLKLTVELLRRADDLVALNAMRRRLEDETRKDTETKFRRLADQWHQETDHLSVTARILAHRAYKQILTLGLDAVPLILEDLHRREGHWFEALELITEANPARDAKTYANAVSAWFRWADEHGFGRSAQEAR